MKTLLISLALSVSLPLAMPALAQQSSEALIQRAYVLRNGGDNRATIALLGPLLAKDSQWSSALEKGKAWNLLGAAYQDIGRLSDARHCHETAIRLLRSTPEAKQELASALDNLGSVENLIGTPESSRSLREAAHQLYEKLGDHAGLARTSNSLATIAIRQGDFKTAKKCAMKASDEARDATNLDDDDRAALESVAGTIAMHNGTSQRAAEYFSRAIAFWTNKHGEQYWMVGLGYSLRAQAYGEIGEQRQAYSDIDRALEIVAHSAGKATALYWRTELLHAQLLSTFGDHTSAKRLEKIAQNGLTQLQRDQCAGCVTTVAGFQASR